MINLLGKEVYNIHRNSCDMTQEYKDSYKGVVVSVKPSDLPLIGVDCNQEFIRMLPIQDLAYTSSDKRVIPINSI